MNENYPDDATYTPVLILIEGSHFYIHAPGLNLSWDERAAYIRWYLGE